MTDRPRPTARLSTSTTARRARRTTGRFSFGSRVPATTAGIIMPETAESFATLSDEEKAGWSKEMRAELEKVIIPRLLDLYFPVDQNGDIAMEFVKAHQSEGLYFALKEQLDEVERYDDEFRQTLPPEPAVPATVSAAAVPPPEPEKRTTHDTRTWLERKFDDWMESRQNRFGTSYDDDRPGFFDVVSKPEQAAQPSDNADDDTVVLADDSHEDASRTTRPSRPRKSPWGMFVEFISEATDSKEPQR